MLPLKHLSFACNLESTKEKNIKENDFFMFGLFVENIKKNKI